MKMEDLVGDGGKGNKRGRVTKEERREDEDGLEMGVDKGGSSPLEESKTCDIMYTRLNLNFDHGMGVKSGSEGMGRDTDFHGYIRERIWEAVHPIFTRGEFLHRRFIVRKPKILTHGQ